MTNPKMGVWGYQNVPDSRPEKNRADRNFKGAPTSTIEDSNSNRNSTLFFSDTQKKHMLLVIYVQSPMLHPIVFYITLW